jgi:hypothetical protein
MKNPVLFAITLTTLTVGLLGCPELESALVRGETSEEEIENLVQRSCPCSDR